MFQSTHPHGVRRYAFMTTLTYNNVSIHAPARGATHIRNANSHTRLVSIHAPARGATPKAQYGDVATVFQSTHPHGVRHSSDLINSDAFKFQSTHPHGVRLTLLEPQRVTDSFNPRTRTGCDRLMPGRAMRIALFQSTHPHGVRRRLFPYYPRYRCFNPRTRTGCDDAAELLEMGGGVSIHAPARGAT